MTFPKTMLTPDRIDRMTSGGYWKNRTIAEILDQQAQNRPDTPAIVGHVAATGQTETLSYAELAERSIRIAKAFARLGIGRGDVISVQLPNWWHFAALHLACIRVGAIINPLMPIFRERELRYMLGNAKTRLLISPAFFRKCDYVELVAGIRADLPDLMHHFAVGGSGETSFETQLLSHPADESSDPVATDRMLNPNEVCQIMYTSGTTGAPKGVMHNSNTHLSDVAVLIDHIGLTGEDILLMSSPMAHQSGFYTGLLLPIALGATVVLQDVWDAETAARLINDHRVSFTLGSTPFVSDIAGVAMAGQALPSLRTFATVGAPVPPALVERIHQNLTFRVLAAWGMTENGIVTMTRHADPDQLIANSAGRALPGYEVRVVDYETGMPVPDGQEGRLQSRGMGAFLGYLGKPEKYDTDADEWFETGDLATMQDGAIRISGRSKDIIIRGGENVPVVEVEQLLYRHELIEEVAIVGMPDERLGERGCAFVRLKEGAEMDLPMAVSFLIDEGLAKNYLPEHWVVVPEMPRTASGKIQKFVLKEQAARLAAD